jgi:tetratricopeptide (TPR) repeat protein
VALERELATVPAADRDRQVALLARLAVLRRDRLARPGDAALAYEAVLELESQHVPTLEALEALYAQLDREKDLLRVLEARADATEDMLERASLHTRVAEIKEKRADGEGAIRAYQASFQANPSNRDTFTAMEKLCYKHERWAEVMELYDNAIRIIEDGSSRAYRLGDLYARRGQVQLQYLHELGEAAASYLKVVELDPDNDTAVKFLESIFSQQGDWNGLIAAYEKRAELTRDDERRLETLRRAARVAGAKLKDPAEAARIYELILKADPADREALDALERFHERNQDWNKLVDVLKKRLASAPAGDAATALLRRIAQICEEGLRDEQRAIEHYLRILEIAPGNKEALEALGRIYESTEQWAEFIDVTRRQIRVTTERNVKALLYFKCGSVMEAKFGKEEDAIRYYDAAIKTSPSCLPAVHGLRDLYLRREDWPRVIQTLELEVKLWQDDKERAGVFAQVGRLYAERLRQPERAMHYYESALAVDPECMPANKALFEHYFELGQWDRAQPLAQALAQKAMREGDPAQRSDFYRMRGVVCRMTGDMRGAAESYVIALEIKPNNIESLDALGELAKAEPNAYDFEATYRELDKIYRKRDDADALLARVRIAEAVMKERDGDLDAAEGFYAQAVQAAPRDFAIVSALVELHANMRRWTHAVDVIVRFLESSPPPSEEVRIRALLRQAEIHADCEMDSHRAVSVLREILRLDPGHQEAVYRMAQELYLLGRFAEARQLIERAIELAAAPGHDIRPEGLARYYYYLGRIIEASGDSRGATSQYRRAAEYDPGYAPPVLALAKRSADAGDQRHAETLLINAAHAAMENGGAVAAVPLQRGLARILLASGDRPAAIEAYRGILAVEPDGAGDRVALAEIYAVDDLPKAISELKKVIDRDIRHAPAYRLLASFYARIGEQDRASRVLATMELLGFAEESDRAAAAKARATLVHQPLRRQLDDDMRSQMLVTNAAASAVGQLYHSIAAEVTGLFPQPAMGENLVPVQTVDDAAFKVALADLGRLYGIEPEVYIGEHVPGGSIALAFPRRILVIDREMLGEADAARRFLLGYMFDGIRGGYSLIYALGRRQRTELAALLRSLLLPESERPGPTNEFVHSLPKRAAKIIEGLSGKRRELDPEDWIEEMLSTAKRAGLFASDDFPSATRMIARLAGESVSNDGSSTALGAVLGGADLVRFYLSDEYHRLRELLSTPLPVAAA